MTSGESVRMCEVVVSPGSYWEPAEFCPNEAAEDSDFCDEHAYAEGPDPDRERDEYLDFLADQ